MKKVVIIGGVAGGAGVAARLSRLEPDAHIVIMERGGYISYANCGLPYHVGNVIPERQTLLMQTPEGMKNKFGIDVRIHNEVISIDKENKVVKVSDLDANRIYEEDYDVLVISTGSSPLRPPIPGIDSDRIKTLWTVPDTDVIKGLMANGVKTAAVIGGGFIGLEMAENLSHAGLKVSLIEAMDQVMAPFDFEMAKVLHGNIIKNGVDLHLSDGVKEFIDKDASVDINLQSGKTINADMVILSIGVRPNSMLAKEAGLNLNQRGGIIVNDNMVTSDPSIYAVGDVIQVEDFINKNPVMIPLAGPANKQARIAAANIAGDNQKYKGTQGTSVAQVFDLVAATTGLNEKTLINQGFIKGKDYEVAYVSQHSHSKYYPGAIPMNIKVIFNMDGSKIYGGQIVGKKGVDKRIDTLAVAIRLGASIYDLQELELAYAPPFSSAKDPINMVGYVAENIINNMMTFAHWDEVKDNKNAILLDVREPHEVAMAPLPNSVHIPIGQLKNRANELDKSKTIYGFCTIGVRAYNAETILRPLGFNDVKIYPAGTSFYLGNQYDNLK